MSQNRETMLETHVTYTLERNGQLIIVEGVPARVCSETGEQFFSPETVETLHSLIRQKPQRTVETPVYDFPALHGAG